MADIPSSEAYKPYFVLDENLDPQVADTLQEFEAAIHNNPAEVLTAVQSWETSDTPPQAAHIGGIILATSKEVGLAGLGFDDLTETALSQSERLKALRQKRKDNEKNELRSQELAAEVRYTRLELFVQRAMEYGDQHEGQDEGQSAVVIEISSSQAPDPSSTYKKPGLKIATKSGRIRKNTPGLTA